MDLSHFLLLLSWMAYCVLHSVLAASRVKSAISHTLRIGPDAYRLWYNIQSVVLLVLLLVFQYSIHSFLLFLPSIAVIVISLLLGGIGLSIMIICIIKYFKQLSGLGLEKHPRLEITGIHQYVRHPLYLGTFLFLVSLFLFFPYFSNLLAMIVIIGYTLVAIRYEERKLVKQFGQSYTQYQQQVPMILPGRGRRVAR